MLEGKIIKGIGGFYYIETSNNKIYTCRARGVFRNQLKTPLVGDNVKIRVSDEKDMEGYIEEIEERKNQLLRPPVSNIDQILIVFSLKNPKINFWLLDKFLIQAESQKLDIVICFNKIDLAKEKEIVKVKKIYEPIGYNVILTSVEKNIGIENIKKAIKNKTTAIAGPSGVGKSTLLNSIDKNLKLETGDISKKTSRGKHTTRHSELHKLEIGGFIFDTPGFSSLDLNFLNEENLSEYFIEFEKYFDKCKFRGCKHYKEPECAIKKAVDIGEISEIRYKNYITFLEELLRK